MSKSIFAKEPPAEDEELAVALAKAIDRPHGAVYTAQTVQDFERVAAAALSGDDAACDAAVQQLQKLADSDEPGHELAKALSAAWLTRARAAVGDAAKRVGAKAKSVAGRAKDVAMSAAGTAARVHNGVSDLGGSVGGSVGAVGARVAGGNAELGRRTGRILGSGLGSGLIIGGSAASAASTSSSAPMKKLANSHEPGQPLAKALSAAWLTRARAAVGAGAKKVKSAVGKAQVHTTIAGGKMGAAVGEAVGPAAGMSRDAAAIKGARIGANVGHHAPLAAGVAATGLAGGALVAGTRGKKAAD